MAAAGDREAVWEGFGVFREPRGRAWRMLPREAGQLGYCLTATDAQIDRIVLMAPYVLLGTCDHASVYSTLFYCINLGLEYKHRRLHLLAGVQDRPLSREGGGSELRFYALLQHLPVPLLVAGAHSQCAQITFKVRCRLQRCRRALVMMSRAW